MGLIVRRGIRQVGTFNGNPLGMAAAKAMLTEVLVPATYAHLTQTTSRMGEQVRNWSRSMSSRPM